MMRQKDAKVEKLRYEKPELVRFDNYEQIASGTVCGPGSNEQTGHCKDGGMAADRCQNGTIAAGVCSVGSAGT
jgi:hypothetical protein